VGDFELEVAVGASGCFGCSGRVEVVQLVGEDAGVWGGIAGGVEDAAFDGPSFGRFGIGGACGER
jgi:hypothetical protein